MQCHVMQCSSLIDVIQLFEIFHLSSKQLFRTAIYLMSYRHIFHMRWVNVVASDYGSDLSELIALLLNQVDRLTYTFAFGGTKMFVSWRHSTFWPNYASLLPNLEQKFLQNKLNTFLPSVFTNFYGWYQMHSSENK